MREVFSFNGDGWWPRVEQTAAETICFGNVESRAWHIGGGLWPAVLGRYTRFIGPSTTTFIQETGGNSAIRFERDLTTDVVKLKEDHNVLGNDFDASKGHWGSCIAAGRLSFDGVVIGSGYRDVQIKWPWAISVFQDREIVWFFEGKEHTRRPLPDRSNALRLNEPGNVSLGYFWDVREYTIQGLIRDVTIAPWNREAPHVVCRGWHWCPTEAPNGKVGIIGHHPSIHPSGHGILIEGFQAIWVDVGYHAPTTSFLVAACDNVGRLRVWSVPTNEPSTDLRKWGTVALERVPLTVPVSSPKFISWYYDHGRDGDFWPACHGTVLGASMYSKDGVTPSDVWNKITDAAARSGGVFLNKHDMMFARPFWHLVHGLWIDEIDNPNDIRDVATEVVRVMRVKNFPSRPVIATLMPSQAIDPRYAGCAEQVACEVYFSLPMLDWNQMLEVARDRVHQILNAMSTPVYLIPQAYDRNGVAEWKEHADQLSAIAYACFEVLGDHRVMGLWPFAYGRKGGARDYPSLIAWYDAQVSVTPRPPLPKNVQEKPMPEFKMPHITDDEFRDMAGRLEDQYENHLVPHEKRHGGPAEDRKRETYVDSLGYGRWITDYITARARGADHETAARAMVSAFRKAANLDPQ